MRYTDRVGDDAVNDELISQAREFATLDREHRDRVGIGRLARRPTSYAMPTVLLAGNFGDLHLPRELPTPKRYQGVDTASFVAAVRRDHGFTLTSPVIG